MIPTTGAFKSKNKFNYYIKPVFPVTITKDSKVLSLEISQTGRSSGVIFVELDSGGIVLKANNDAAQDYFFNQLALQLGVDTPPMLVLPCYDPQFVRLVYLIEQYCHTDQVLYARLKNKLDFPFHQLMQYVPSVSLIHVGEHKFRAHMLEQYKLHSLGMCLGFDLLINNNDRFALLWRGDGNMNNCLIEVPQPGRGDLEQAKQRDNVAVNLSSFVYIDHDGHMLDMEDPLAKQNGEKYGQIFSEFHLNVIQYLRQEISSPAPEFDKLVKQFRFFTQYSFTEEDLVRISEGIIYATKKFIDLFENKTIHGLYESNFRDCTTKKKQVNYWNEYWNKQLRKVNLSFCEMLYIKVSAIYSTYPELITQVCEKVTNAAQKHQGRKDRRRRDSQASRKSSQVLSDKLGGEDRVREDQSEKDEREEEAQQKSKQDQKKRRWREKLEVFRQQNYK